jgi:membrane-bound serine protease (ClpP class)
LFVPGGIPGTIGLIMMAIAIFFVYSQHGVPAGVGLTLITVIALPIIIVKAVERNSLHKKISAEEGYVAGPGGLDKFAGAEGTALTALRPVGTALLNGERADVVAESEMIDKDAAIRVVKIEGNRIVVRQTAPPPRSPLSVS